MSFNETPKRCPSCQVTKTRADFSRAPSRSDGVNSYCRDCCRERARAWRATPEGRARSVLATRTYRAKKRAAQPTP